MKAAGKRLALRRTACGNAPGFPAELRVRQSLAPRPRRSKANAAPSRVRKLGESADLGQQLEYGRIVRGELSALTLDLAGELVDPRCDVVAFCDHIRPVRSSALS